MIMRRWMAGLGGLLVVALVLAPCGCKRQASAGPGDDNIHVPPLKDQLPDAVAPEVDFPQQLRTDDVTVNEFIHKALDACRTGDYDAFRQLFGVTSEPPEEPQFGHVWKGVKSIRVAGTYKDDRRGQQPPEYYVHVVVQLRRPDRYDRTERQAVLWLFREGNEWRMAPAPGEIQGRVLYADTQPADGRGATTRPSRRHAASRPTAGTTLPAR